MKLTNMVLVAYNNHTAIKQCDCFILLLLLATPTTQFSLDHKRRSGKRNPDRNSAYDSDGLIFTRSLALIRARLRLRHRG